MNLTAYHEKEVRRMNENKEQEEKEGASRNRPSNHPPFRKIAHLVSGTVQSIKEVGLMRGCCLI